MANSTAAATAVAAKILVISRSPTYRHENFGMPKPEAFNTMVDYYVVLFHEATHATGHKKRLGRFTDDEGGAMFGSKSYSAEELTAQMGACFLAAEAGIDLEAHVDNSAAYVANWLKRLKGDSHLIVQAAGKAQKAADHILNVTWAK